MVNFSADSWLNIFRLYFDYLCIFRRIFSRQNTAG